MAIRTEEAEYQQRELKKDKKMLRGSEGKDGAIAKATNELLKMWLVKI